MSQGKVFEDEDESIPVALRSKASVCGRLTAA